MKYHYSQTCIKVTLGQRLSDHLRMVPDNTLYRSVSVSTQTSSHALDLIITRNAEDVVLDYTVHDPSLSENFSVHFKLMPG